MSSQITPNCHRYLNKQVVQLLSTNGITEMYKFCKTESEKIIRQTKHQLNMKQIVAIKTAFNNQLLPALQTGLELYLKEMQEVTTFRSKITGLDEILGGGLTTGQIYEIFGNAGNGKSILIDTLVVNIVDEKDCEVLYLDTKSDFSAVRLQKIMKAKGFPDEKILGILKKIRVQKVYSVDELIETSTLVLKNITQLQNLKILVIDSLPAIFYHFLEKHNTMAHYINYIFNILSEIASSDVMILVTNIVSNYTSQENSKASSQSSADSKKSDKETEIEFRPALGKYFATLATQRILICPMDPDPFSNPNTELNILERKLTLTKSSHMESGNHITRNVLICDWCC